MSSAGRRPALRAAIGVIAVALTLRLLFGRLIADTYDFDEFVLLLLARDFSHGAVPYRDFMFFHPPGAIVLLRGIGPLTSAWWPSARLATTLIDSLTAGLVYYVGVRIFDRRAALAAGLVYAAAPLALVSAVRVGQDPLITFCGLAAVALLLTGEGPATTVLAGVCLGIGVWIKYPALYFVPVCLLLAPRRFPLVIAGAAVTVVLLFLPFSGQHAALYSQTINYQHNRWSMALDLRFETTAIFWLALNLPALAALTRRQPAWLLVGFGLGALFLATPQVYYHYFVPVVPFAALLTGSALSRIRHWSRPVVAAALLLPVLAVAAVIDLGGHSPLFVTAARLSEVAPTVRLLEARSGAAEPVLADRYEYAYLADRPALAHYFWNVGVLVDASYLEARVGAARAVVLSSGASSGYPVGFTAYLDRHYPRLHPPTTEVWIVPRARR